MKREQSAIAVRGSDAAIDRYAKYISARLGPKLHYGQPKTKFESIEIKIVSDLAVAIHPQALRDALSTTGVCFWLLGVR